MCTRRQKYLLLYSLIFKLYIFFCICRQIIRKILKAICHKVFFNDFAG